jgi:hypothetical protein
MAAKPYQAATGKSRVKRAKAGAPLAQGVKGKTQALMNMEPNARFAAEAKSKLRATNPNKGKPGGNLVNKTTRAITGSTKKATKFTK